MRWYFLCVANLARAFGERPGESELQIVSPIAESLGFVSSVPQWKNLPPEADVFEPRQLMC